MRDIFVEGATRILVAEDHPTNQLVTQSLLRWLGYAPTLAADGVETLAALEAEPTAFALVLMDCHMPNLDGYEATRLIRERERELGQPRLPILAVTASVFPEDRIKAEQAGMDGFLAKPVRLATLREVLEETLSRPPREPVAPPDTEASLATRARELLFIGGPELLVDVRRIFLAEAERISSALSQSFEANDPRQVGGLAHMLKGASLNVGAEGLADLARRLEVTARAGTLSGADEMLRALQLELTNVAHLMRAWCGESATVCQCGDTRPQ